MAMSMAQAAAASPDLVGCFWQKVRQLIPEPAPNSHDDTVQGQRAQACFSLLRQMFFADPTRQLFVGAFLSDNYDIAENMVAKLLVAVSQRPMCRISFASYGTPAEGPDAELVCGRVLLLAGHGWTHASRVPRAWCMPRTAKDIGSCGLVLFCCFLSKLATCCQASRGFPSCSSGHQGAPAY